MNKIFPSAAAALKGIVADGQLLAVGVQNIHWEDKGAFTGETSASLARSAGARYALVGHSERRHVFGEKDVRSAHEQTVAWEVMKAAERARKAAPEGPASALDGVARALPALLRAEKLQKRAARPGFDWTETPPIFDKLEEEVAEVKAAIAGGAAAFKVNCVQCHGAGAAGYQEFGYPNLNDDDWIWGGTLTDIEYTLTHGIRWEAADATRVNYMPAFEGVLDAGQLGAVTRHVLSLSGKAQPDAAGAQAFADNCAACHGPAGGGMPVMGAPALNDAIWLYGGGEAAVKKQILAPRHGVMPAWNERLDPVTIKMLAAYVHSRGGGQDPAPATPAATPTGDVAQAPEADTDG